MTVKKARDVCEMLASLAESFDGEKSVAALNVVENVVDKLDAEDGADWEETQVEYEVWEASRFVAGLLAKKGN